MTDVELSHLAFGIQNLQPNGDIFRHSARWRGPESPRKDSPVENLPGLRGKLRYVGAMVDTLSNMLPLGTSLPEFSLVDAVTGQAVNTRGLQMQHGVLVMFICNHCPFVIHIRHELVRVAHEALDMGYAVIAVNSNSIDSHPQDGPEHMKELASSESWRFPFVFDSSQNVAKAFSAACTPDLYLFDRLRKLVYRGQFDDSRPSNGKPVTGADLRAALSAIAAGLPVPAEQRASIGCNIKWKSN
jgi:peroxiredoxin